MQDRAEVKEVFQKHKAALAQKKYTSRERISSTNMAASLFFGHCKPEIERIYGHMRGSLGNAGND